MAPGVNGPTLNVKQFQVLTKLLEQGVHFSQREMAELLRYSLGTINKTVRELTEQKLIVDGHVSSLGLEALEPYRVKRAVFLAAGFGPRLVPVTLNTPKPLVRIKGVRMIDTLLDAAVAAEIEEIYIVRGYLGEQFDQLLYKYPNIRFIENPRYNEENNISSAMCARHLFQNAYVLEADFILYNPSLIQKYQYASNYLGVPVETSDDWCFETKNHVISKLKIGGTNCYHVFGISYWNADDGKRLAEDIKKVYEMPGGKERYWDQVPLEFCRGNYQVEVRTCTFDDITEIDSFADLKRIDSTYRS